MTNIYTTDAPYHTIKIHGKYKPSCLLGKINIILQEVMKNESIDLITAINKINNYPGYFESVASEYNLVNSAESRNFQIMRGQLLHNH